MNQLFTDKMKKNLLLLAGLLAATMALAQPKITGHRGCRFEGPYENTLASLAFAQSLGIPSVEFDVQLTADRKVIVYHGPQIPGEEGKTIWDLTYDQARAVRLPGGHQMPSLEEWLEQADRTPELSLFLEVKQQRDEASDELLVRECMAILRRTGHTGSLSWTSFSEHICDYVLAQEPDAKVYYIGTGLDVPSPGWAVKKGYKGLSYTLNSFMNNPGLAENAEKAGLETVMWLVNNPELYEWAKKHHVTWVSSDHPEILKEYIERQQGLPAKGFVYRDASSLTLVGKLFPDTPHPYHRVDTARFHGFTAGENYQVRSSSGIAVAFRSDAPSLSIMTQYGQKNGQERTGHIAAWGYDLYVREGGRWVYAAAGVCEKPVKSDAFTLIKSMDGRMKEFLLYLPLYCEVKSVKIGVPEGSAIEPIPNPFRHRIGVFGSSYTQGSNCSRGGMTWVAQLSRETGFELLSLGCGGNCKLQDYFCDVMAAVDCEAYLFDAFSNPSPDQMKQRLFPFIEKLQAARPGVPLIFMQTIRRETRNFNLAAERSERAKMETADSLMKIACARYKDVYFIRPNASSKDYASFVDGIHPSNHGYWLWMDSVKKPVYAILKKYGIQVSRSK